ncbi:MAG: hypothetical protein JWM59_199 [Verrucomicrobiales bacterium]|nr:hypothetical protein [Verrucomicrobiales bacterium]
MMSPGFPEPAVHAPPPPRTGITWLLGVSVMITGAFLIWTLLMGWLPPLPLGGSSPPGSCEPGALLVFHLLGLTLFTLGIRFIRRPDLKHLRTIIGFFTFGAGLCLAGALNTVCGWMLPKKSAFAAALLTVPVLLLPAYVLALVRCAGLTGLGRLNPWRAVNRNWLVILMVGMSVPLTYFLLDVWPSLLPQAGSGSGSDGMLPAFISFIRPCLLYMPILAPVLFTWRAAWWLSRKAQAWDARHAGAE